MAGGPPALAVKGDRALEAGAHPEVVLITAKTSNNPNTGSCTGVLIAANVVLTTAHGIEGFDCWEVTAPFAKQGPSTVVAKAAKFHPAHKSGVFESDLAVLILEKEIDIGGRYPSLHDGDLLPIDTKLQVVGRVSQGVPSNSQLYQGSVTLVPLRGDINLYGGLPQVAEGGDSGGPVYLSGKKAKLVALIGGHNGFSRWNVPTDIYVPISRKNRDWIVQQVPKAADSSRRGESPP